MPESLNKTEAWIVDYILVHAPVQLSFELYQIASQAFTKSNKLTAEEKEHNQLIISLKKQNNIENYLRDNRYITVNENKWLLSEKGEEVKRLGSIEKFVIAQKKRSHWLINFRKTKTGIILNAVVIFLSVVGSLGGFPFLLQYFASKPKPNFIMHSFIVDTTGESSAYILVNGTFFNEGEKKLLINSVKLKMIDSNNNRDVCNTAPMYNNYKVQYGSLRVINSENLYKHDLSDQKSLEKDERVDGTFRFQTIFLPFAYLKYHPITEMMLLCYDVNGKEYTIPLHKVGESFSYPEPYKPSNIILTPRAMDTIPDSIFTNYYSMGKG